MPRGTRKSRTGIESATRMLLAASMRPTAVFMNFEVRRETKPLDCRHTLRSVIHVLSELLSQPPDVRRHWSTRSFHMYSWRSKFSANHPVVVLDAVKDMHRAARCATPVLTILEAKIG